MGVMMIKATGDGSQTGSPAGFNM